MKYEKPKCDCGEELVFFREYIFTYTQTITTNGYKCKKILKSPKGTVHIGNLYCEKCNKCYDWKLDEKDRIIREGDDY